MTVLALDSVMIWFAIWLALSLKSEQLYSFSQGQIAMLLMANAIAVLTFIPLGLYLAVIRFVGFRALWAVFKAVSIFSMIWGVLAVMMPFGIPPSTPVIVWALLLILVGGSRLVGRWYFAYRLLNHQGMRARRKVLIYGAGEAGAQLVRVLSYTKKIETIGFIDDDESRVGSLIEGRRVYSKAFIDQLIEDYDIDEILLAMPSVPARRRQEIIRELERYSVAVRLLPGLEALAEASSVSISDVREVELEDLLDRDPVKPDQSLLKQNIADKVVMVTGAGGSIGSELCRQIAGEAPLKLICFDHHEYSLYALAQELSGKDTQCIFILGSVVDQPYLEQVISEHGVQTIYHAAAYKHVPLVEWNPLMGIRVNVLGTLRCVEAAKRCAVETFVLISTDKAVRPTNVMGATKRFAEMILQAYAHENKAGSVNGKTPTRFTMVRFGNVIGSSGSVVPLFKKQIAQGGPVTVTDESVTRYFMTIPEAVQLVIQAGAMGHGGEVFVLEMGVPVRIDDLARRMIRLSGYSVKSDEQPEGDIEIHYSGLRPGEKLHEELLIGDDFRATDHARIMRANETFIPLDQLNRVLEELLDRLDSHDSRGVVRILKCSIEGYVPDGRQWGNVDDSPPLVAKG